MLLSICCTFCDKDYIYIEKLVKHLSRVVHINYEVILIDNRDKFRSAPLNVELPVYSMNGNKGCFLGRKEAAKHINGDYVWYIDADDLVLDVPQSFNSILEKNYDEIRFNFIESDVKSQWSSYENTIYNKETFEIDTHAKLPVWARIIKASIFKQLLDVEWDKAQVLQEDVLVSLFFENKCENIVFYNKYLYYYNNAATDAMGEIKNISQIDRLLTGSESLRDFAKVLFPMYIPLEVAEYLSSCQSTYLITERVSKIKDKKFQNKVIRFIINKKGISKEETLKALKEIGILYKFGLIIRTK